jgi:lipopolysaccharide export system permease protein
MTKRYESLAGKSGSLASFGSDGLWLREGTDEGQSVIRADRADPDGRTLHGVTFLEFDASGQPQTRIEALSASLVSGRWIARQAKVWNLGSDANPEAAARRLPELVMASGLTSEGIEESFGTPDTVSVWDMRAFIDRLDRAGFSSRRHAVALQSELALPLLLAAMVLLGAGFTMRHTRFGQTGLFVLMALGSGIAIFFLRNFAQVLGESGQIPVLLAAWSPPVAALLFSLALLLHLEDG